MRYIQQPYQGEVSRAKMLALVHDFPGEHLHVVDLPYRLCSWALDDPGNVRLWTDESGRLQAWAVMQLPFWTVDYGLNPLAGPDLLKDVFAWADRRAVELLSTPESHPSWYIDIFGDQALKMRVAEAAGFRSQGDVGEDSWSQIWLSRPGNEPLRDYRLPSGYTVRPLAGEAEIEAYVALHRSVFESKNMTPEWRRRILQHPAYRPDLDIVAVAPDGGLAAFCIGWYWQEPGKAPVGQIEPLGCGQEFRHLALGRVVLAEVLRCMQRMGVESVYVITDNFRNTALALYESLGFQSRREITVFRKDYPAVAG